MAEKIKVVIAGRNYPLTINPEEETYIRNASKKIDEMVKNIEANYAINDIQDALAMCSLQLASQLEKYKGNSAQREEKWGEQLDSISDKIEKAI